MISEYIEPTSERHEVVGVEVNRGVKRLLWKEDLSDTYPYLIKVACGEIFYSGEVLQLESEYILTIPGGTHCKYRFIDKSISLSN